MPDHVAQALESPAINAIVVQVEALAPARAWSPNTVRAFLSDLRLWDQWCRRRGLTTSRADADAVAAYLRGLSGVDQDPRNPLKVRAPAAIECYLVNIGWAYRWRDPKTVLRYGARLAAKSGASERLAKRLGAE